MSKLLNDYYRVNKNKPCPICGKPDWCLISRDGKYAICARYESPRKMAEAGYRHRIDGKNENLKKVEPPKQSSRFISRNEIENLAYRYKRESNKVNFIAERLGVSYQSLDRLDVGYDYDSKAWVFPMRDEKELVCGIRYRNIDGKKWSLKGSRNGLFWPDGIWSGGYNDLVICEGASDTAALLDLGFDVLGRPSCNSGNKMICEFLKGRGRDVYIMADRDEPKLKPNGEVFRPGQDGAYKLARDVKKLVKNVKVVTPPKRFKDVRQWVNVGASRELIISVFNNQKWS